MPARNPQCQGQAFLLPIFCGDKILLPGIDHLPCTAAPIKRTRPGLHGGVISRLLAPNVPADVAVVESLVRVAFKTVRITGPSSALDTAAITEILQRDYSNMIRRSSAGTRKSNPKSRIQSQESIRRQRPPIKSCQAIGESERSWELPSSPIVETKIQNPDNQIQNPKSKIPAAAPSSKVVKP